ncbi:putative uncharacterized protein [Clostridium sp. CAG:524]|jgi:saccharopine dehydrogenase-like NADP-dependent oxidoreductase|nr:putative uncharacterized protein [Clostridium sp. CAG:524]
MKKNKGRGVIVIFIIVGIILFGYLGYRVKNDFFKGSERKKLDSIELYGYTLSKNDTEIYKTYFKELSKVLNEKTIDYTEYAKLISKLFVIDLYTLDNKLASTDIGGLEFLHKDLKDNFKENMGSTLYNFVESNIDGKRTQELPIVKDVNVSDVFETKYTYNKTEYDAYIVSTDITYEKDLGYPKSMKLTIIKDNNILYIVKGE